MSKYKFDKIRDNAPNTFGQKNRAIKQCKIIRNFMRKCNQHPKSKLVLDLFHWLVLISLVRIDDSFHYYSNSSLLMVGICSLLRWFSFLNMSIWNTYQTVANIDTLTDDSAIKQDERIHTFEWSECNHETLKHAQHTHTHVTSNRSQFAIAYIFSSFD